MSEIKVFKGQLPGSGSSAKLIGDITLVIIDNSPTLICKVPKSRGRGEMVGRTTQVDIVFIKLNSSPIEDYLNIQHDDVLIPLRDLSQNELPNQ